MRVKPKTASARQLDRDRFGLDHDPVSPFMPEKVSDMISKVVKRSGLEDAMWERDLLEKWEEIAGQELAKHTRPGGFERGVLTVYVDSSPWLSVLEREFKSTILKSIQKQIASNKIKSLYLKLDPLD